MITMRPQFQISTRKIKLLLSLTAACCLLACMSIKRGEFDQRSYDSAIANKAIVTRLVAKSTQVDSFLAHESKIHQLIEKMDAVQAHTTTIEYNSEASKQWRGVIDSIINPWLEVWKEQGQLSAPAAAEVQMQVVKGFDNIICIELLKREQASCEALLRSQ